VRPSQQVRDYESCPLSRPRSGDGQSVPFRGDAGFVALIAAPTKSFPTGGLLLFQENANGCHHLGASVPRHFNKLG
jgi:hypothetical protein